MHPGTSNDGPDPASNVGRWDPVYRLLPDPRPYGDTLTYEKAARFLAGLDTVEDWGCGWGWFKRYLDPGVQYKGVDGSHSPAADEVADLTRYTSHVEGILLRHVLEHNDNWRSILSNALRSFTRRLVIVLFTPFVETTRRIGYTPELGVPDIAFARDDLTPFFTGLRWSLEEGLQTGTQYGVEHIFYISCETQVKGEQP
jgi:hypothetical protein